MDVVEVYEKKKNGKYNDTIYKMQAWAPCKNNPCLYVCCLYNLTLERYFFSIK